MAERKKLVLIDGHSNIHKAYHAIKQPLTSPQGEPTGAVFGFLNMFLRVHRELEVEHVAVVFDPPGPSFRKQTYAEYKANRPPAPEDLKQQEARIREMLTLMGVPVVEVAPFEADDVLAALALRAIENGGEAMICSTDKDLLQMVRPGIVIWRDHLSKTEVLDEQGVFGKMGVRPEQIPVYLGLVGDSSDNIPGVPGIGAKGAAKLLAEYGDLESLLAAAPSMKKSRVATNLVEHADAARLSTDLATLKTDCVTAFDWDQFLWQLNPTNELRTFCRTMGFQSFLAELGGDTVDQREVEYETVRDRKALERVCAEIRKAGMAAIDTETTDLDTFAADLVGISLSWKKGRAAYLPVGHSGGGEQLTPADLKEVLGPLLVDTSIAWVAHHWNFDYKVLKSAGLAVGNIAGDTMIAAYLINPDRPGSLRLKELAVSRLGIQMTEISELIGLGDMVTMASVSVDESAEYACQDADATWQLHEDLLKSVREAEMEKLYRDVEVPLIPVLAEMELEGVRLDVEHLRKLSAEADLQLSALTKEIHEMAGRPFKINSPKQVAELLFDELNLTKGKKGKSGTQSTDMSVLESLKNEHPLPAKLLEYRQVEKLKNTYIDPLPGMVNPRTGKLHTSLNQTVAATGRLSSSNPNLQNIPVRTEAGRQIRRAFIPREEGWKLLAADYSQIELRILAHLSGDAALQEAFKQGSDIHALTASKVFGAPLEKVTPTQRNQAKAINFGIIYGMSDFRLSRDLEIPRATARQFIDEYFRVYSGVHRFIEETKEMARRDRYVTTMLGRRRFIPEINSSNANQRGFAERIAVNTPIQGTSADMIKAAMIRIANRLHREQLRARMILQVHDELIFDVPEQEIEQLSQLVQKEMAGALPLDVPIRVDVSVGDNWADCK